MTDPLNVDLSNPAYLLDTEKEQDDLVRKMVDLGISPELLVDPAPLKRPSPVRPEGEIVWYMRSGDDVYQVEKLEAPVLRGAGMRTHRLWYNGNPTVGPQWCYSLEDAQWWADYLMTRDLKMQLSRLKTRVLDLESKLSRQRFTPQPY